MEVPFLVLRSSKVTLGYIFIPSTVSKLSLNLTLYYKFFLNLFQQLVVDWKWIYNILFLEILYFSIPLAPSCPGIKTNP